jgi:hypothetical protein
MSVRHLLVLGCLAAVLGCGGGGAHKLSEAEQKAAEEKMRKQMQDMGANLPAKVPGVKSTGTGNQQTK